MSSSQLKSDRFKKREFKKLCHILGFDKNQISNLLETVDSNYKEWSEEKLDKNGKPKTYLDGTIKKRTFRNPSSFLKTVQKRIKTNILDKCELPENVHGGVKGKSNITNAKKHQGNKYLFETDLQEFYPNISMKNVYEVFTGLGYSSHMAHWLTKLCTKSNELPQGSPTSQALANLAFLKTDYQLIELCKKRGVTYTRYVDDLTFSSQSNFEDIIQKLLDTVIKNDFKISRRKTNYEGKQSVTGICVLLNKIDAPPHIHEKAKNELSTNSVTKPYTNYVNRIQKTNAKKGVLSKSDRK